MNRIQILFERFSGINDYRISPLPSSGGNRQYFRITWSGGSCIAAIGTSQEENAAFLYMARHFGRLGLPVPGILAVSDDGMTYLQEDLGSTTLFDAVAAGRKSGEYSGDERRLLRRAVETLPAFQYAGASGMDFSKCFPVQYFDRTSIMFDLNYFKYCFLKPSGVEFSETDLEEDFNDPVPHVNKPPVNESCLWHGVIATGTPRIASQDAPGGKPATFHHTVRGDSLDGILRTSRSVDARCGQERRGIPLVKAHRCDGTASRQVRT